MTNKDRRSGRLTLVVVVVVVVVVEEEEEEEDKRRAQKRKMRRFMYTCRQDEPSFQAVGTRSDKQNERTTSSKSRK